MNSKSTFFKLLLVGVATFIFQDAIQAQFSGYYDPINWTVVQVNSANGTVSTVNAPPSIALTGPDNTVGNAYTRYEIEIPSTGTVSFDWSVLHNDPTYDGFGYYKNGTYTQLTSVTASGATSVPVAAGDIFAFYGHTFDGCCGTFTATISNFDGPFPQTFNDAGVEAIISPTPIMCSDDIPVRVAIRNYGINQIQPVTVEWSVDGVMQTPFVYNGLLDTLGGSSLDTAHVTIGSYTFADSNDLVVWTTSPNSMADTTPDNDTNHLDLFAPNPQIAVSDTSFCSGDVIVLNAGTGYDNYTWSNGASSQMIQILTGGTYSVSIQDAYGCQAVGTAIVTELTSPTVPFGQQLDACGEAYLDATNANSSYSWSTNENSAAITVTQSGVYTVTISNNLGCVSEEAVYVNIMQSPMVNLGPNKNVCVDLGQYDFLAVTSGHASYDWSTGETTSSITIGGLGTPTGTETYSVLVTGTNGCTSADTVNITFKNCIPAGIAEAGNDDAVSIYPNPSNGNTTLELSNVNAETVEVALFDVAGRQIETIYNGSASGTLLLNLDLSHLNNAVYYVRVKSDDVTTTRSLIIE